MAIKQASSLNALRNPPAHKDQILMPDGSLWTLIAGMNGWTLYDNNDKPHPRIKDIKGMIDLLSLIFMIFNA